MGLDTVELILEIEETFDIKITDEEAVRVGTVGEISKFIAKKLTEKTGDSISYEEPMKTLIDILVNNYGIPRQHINTSSHVVYDLGLD